MIDVDLLRVELEKVRECSRYCHSFNIIRNDFLPRIPTYNISEDIQTLFVYSKVVGNDTSGASRLVKENSLDMGILEKIVQKFAETEIIVQHRNFLIRYYGRNFVERIERDLTGTPMGKQIEGGLNEWLKTNRMPAVKKEAIQLKTLIISRNYMKKQEEDFLHLMNKKCINLIECWIIIILLK